MLSMQKRKQGCEKKTKKKMGKFPGIKLFYFFILPTRNTFRGPTIKSV